MALGTKEEIMREYGMLAYVPGEIANNAMCGVWALRQVRGVGVENLGGLKVKERRKCFWHACRAGVDFCIIRSLYESLSVVNRVAGGMGLAGAASGGHLDIIEAFIGTFGVDVDAVDEYGNTALMHAAQNGHTDTVNALAGTHNANVEAVDQNGSTALMFAAYQGHTDTVNALRQHGATSQTRPETDGYGPGTSPGLLADEFGSLELSAGNAHLLADDTVPSEQLTCSICMHHMPSVRFHPCGHTACRADARQLRRRRADCHICRQPITEFQPMFL